MLVNPNNKLLHKKTFYYWCFLMFQIIDLENTLNVAAFVLLDWLSC